MGFPYTKENLLAKTSNKNNKNKENNTISQGIANKNSLTPLGPKLNKSNRAFSCTIKPIKLIKYIVAKNTKKIALILKIDFNIKTHFGFIDTVPVSTQSIIACFMFFIFCSIVIILFAHLLNFSTFLLLAPNEPQLSKWVSLIFLIFAYNPYLQKNIKLLLLCIWGPIAPNVCLKSFR